ncbi:MAG: TonB-dependent receptor [Deltaproteobacteria bacterium]|nr:TonB-dependent receptor [Deltaproteobacteria bacterium]
MGSVKTAAAFEWFKRFEVFRLIQLSVFIFVFMFVKAAAADDKVLTSNNGEGKDDLCVFETVIEASSFKPQNDSSVNVETINLNGEYKNFKSVDEVVSDASGVQVRRLGGTGSGSYASIHGSTPGQVPVFVDGVLLNSGSSGAVDFSELNLILFDEINIYKGGAPVTLGSSGIGGAISLKTRSFLKPVSILSLTYGSFDTYRLTAVSGSSFKKTDILALVSLQGSKGDFTYLNLNGTPNNTDDDTFEKRINNEHNQATAFLKMDRRYKNWKFTIADALMIKKSGVPGMGNIPAYESSYSFLNNRLDFGADLKFDRDSFLKFKIYYTHNSDDFKDIYNETGVGAQYSNTKTDDAGGSVIFSKKWSDSNRTALNVSSRFEGLNSENRITKESDGYKFRVLSEIGIEHDFTPVKSLLIDPALRVTIINSRFNENNSYVVKVDNVYYSPSAGFKYEVIKNLFIIVNGGSYLRPPDIYEMFGDSGFITGNPDLLPEKGLNGNGGINWKLRSSNLKHRAFLTVSWFGSVVDNMIAYVQNSQNSVRAENVDKALLTGVETSARLKLFSSFGIEGNYTYMFTENRSRKPYHYGKKLPGHPEHEAFLKLFTDKRLGNFKSRLFITGDYAGQSYLDQANLKENALGRLFFSTGIRLDHYKSGLSFDLTVKNIFNKITAEDSNGNLRPLRDFEGFPLPGRSVFATLSWSAAKS